MIASMLGYVAITTGWTVYKLLTLRADGKGGTAGVYVCLMWLSIFVGACYLLHVRLPSSAALARIAFEPIGRWLMRT